MGREILKLKLQNFRRLIETDLISFQPGLTIISGPNGAGKSTLVESVIYALYGPKHGQAREIRSDNATGDVRVECELLIDDQLVKVIRSGSSAELWVNNMLQVQGIPSSLSEANRQIGRLLGGLTRDQFERTYVALQGDTAGLVGDLARKRREIIESILQFEVLREAVKLQERRRDDALNEVKSQGRNLSDDLGLATDVRSLLQQFLQARKLATRMQHMQRFRAAAEVVLAQRQRQADEAEAATDVAEAEVKRWEQQEYERKQALVVAESAFNAEEEKQKLFQDLIQPIASIDGSIKQNEADIRRSKEDIAQAERCAEVAEEYGRLLDEVQSCKQRLRDLPLIKDRYQALQAAIRGKDELKDKLQALAQIDEEMRQALVQEKEAKQAWEMLHDKDPTHEELEGWRMKKAEIASEESRYEEARKVLEDTPDEARCPTCNQALTVHTLQERLQHLTRWLEETLPTLLSRLDEQKAYLDRRKALWKKETQDLYDKWQDFIEATSRVKDRLRQRDDFLSRQENAIADLQKAQEAWNELGEDAPYNPAEEPKIQGVLLKLKERAEELRQDAERYQRLPILRTQLEDKQRELDNLLGNLNKLRARQEAIGYDQQAYEIAKSAVSSARDALSSVQNQLATAKLHHLDYKTKAERAREGVERTQLHHSHFLGALSEFQREDRLYTLLDDFTRYFFAATTEEVAQRTTQLLLYAVTDQSILGIKFDNDELYYLDSSHKPQPVNRLSGGEKALVGLCLRIALAEQAQAITRIGKVRFLILDEVLSSLDEERRDAVQRIFEDVQRHGIFEHIIMITHLDTIKQDWHAAGLEVQKVGSKSSVVTSVIPGETLSDLFEEIEV